MYQEEPLASSAGSVCNFGVKITSDFETIRSMGRRALTDLMYKYKFILIRGMRDLDQDQFWEISNLFGNGNWGRPDYEISREPCVPTRASSNRVYAPYDNKGITGKVLGDGEMSWHVDVPLWPSHQLPMRSFYATSIPDNNYGITRFADRAYGVDKLSEQDRQEFGKWSLLYHSWYEHGTSLTYTPVLQTHPVTGQEYFSFTSFSNSMLEYSHDYYKWRAPGWIIGAMRDGVPQNADIVSRLHKYVIQPENIYDHRWQEQDFLIYSNVHMIHARTTLRSDLHDKPRSFYRLNVFNEWQENNNVF